MHLEEDTPNCPVPTSSASDTDASVYMTPVAHQGPTELTAEPVMPCLQSLSSTPGFSAFKRVKDPVYLRSETPKADSSMSPHKVSVPLKYVNYLFR